MARRDAFARARGFLDFLPSAKWLAIVAGVMAGVVCLFLLFFLGLCFDLLIHQGRLPAWSDLSPAERDAFLATRADSDQPPEILWRAALAQSLEDRVGPEAANHYLEWADQDPERFGMLGLVARNRDRWRGVPLGWLARWTPGLWRLGAHAKTTYLLRLGILIMVTLLVLIALEVMAGQAASRAAGEAGSRLRRAVYQHTFRRGSLVLKPQGPAEAVSLFTRHVEAVQQALFAWLAVFPRPIQIGMLLFFILVISPWLTLAMLLLVALVLAGLLRGDAYRARQEQLAALKAGQQLALMQESLRLMRLVKSYLMDLFAQQRLDRQLATFAGHELRLCGIDAAWRSLRAGLIGLALAIWLGIAGWLVLSQRAGVSEVIIVGLACGLAALAWLDRQSRQAVLRRGQESADILFDFIDQPGDVAQDLSADALPPLQRQVEFDNVSLREADGSRMLLEDITLKVSVGRRLGIVGGSEREKHALISLLPRFVDPASGEVRFDENNLRGATLESLRGQIGLVLRHNLVFNDTVLQNIGCGAVLPKLPQITEAAKLAHAHQFIQKLPHGYDTLIGDLGYPLDRGEQFRIALARAILRQPALLIIEEPAAHEFDSATLTLLDDTYQRIMMDRTVVFLPHRVATLKLCDQLILLRDGRVAAAGTYRDLLAGNEYYQHLHYLEFNPFADTA